jgi:hypothetical protein
LATALPVRRFDSAAGDELGLLGQIKRVEQQARITGKVFSARRRPRNIKARMLSYELEEFWKAATGKRAGCSGAATIDKPRSHFGTFVKLALDTTGWASHGKIFLQILGVKTRKK